MRLTGAQVVCEALIREGVDLVFGLPGGAILPLYQTFPDYPQLRHVLVRHEQGAGHAADGYARASGRVGVCVATSGPGATNLVTPLATAMMDSVPIVALTGQVPRAAIGRDAFQETDTTGVTLPVTKHNYLVMNAADLPRLLKEAFHVARSGRPGPVLLDLPRDVLTEETNFDYPDEPPRIRGYSPTTEGHPQMVRRAVLLIDEARSPLILAGHGVVIAGAQAELQELAEKAQIPVITTLLGIGGFRQGHVLSLGMPGMHGMAYNNWAIDRADLLIAVGMRFDDRVTGRLSSFAPNARVIHVDVDPAEIGKNVHVEVPVVGDAKRVLRALADGVKPSTRLDWLGEIERLKDEHPSHRLRESDRLLPQYVVQTLSEVTNGDAVIVTGVGQHQMWAAQHFTYRQPGSFISSGGLGTMGFEVPAALGAAMARPDKVVWSIGGDGGFQMTMAELATIVEQRVPVKFALINNNGLGAVRQLQDLFYGRTRVAVGYTGNPDFVKLADAYGVWAVRVTEKQQVRDAVESAMAHPGPALIDFHVEPEENVYPHVPAGEGVAEMLEGPQVGGDQVWEAPRR